MTNIENNTPAPEEEERVTPRPYREIQAWEEIGHTDFHVGVRIALLVIFLTAILAVPIIQHLLPDSTYQLLTGQLIETRAPQGVALYTATIKSISEGPQQNAVYNDFVMQLEIVNTEHVPDPDASNEQAAELPKTMLINTLGMDNRVITSTASLKVGDQITFTVEAWEAVQDTYGGLKSSTINNDALIDTPLMWAPYVQAENKQRGPHATEFYDIWSGRGASLPEHARLPVVQGMKKAWASDKHDSLLDRFLATNGHLAKRIGLYEDGLDEANILTISLQPKVQELFLRVGMGNEKAYVGKDGWLFFEPGIKMLVGPSFLDEAQLKRRKQAGDSYTEPAQPDPRKAIIDFHKQLQARGVTLVLMPTPVKPSIHPEYLTGRLKGQTEALHNRSYEQFIQDIQDAGVIVYESANLIKKRAIANNEAQYLKTDTHWRSSTMQVVAKDLSEMLRGRFSVETLACDSMTYTKQEAKVTQFGDIATMLKLPNNQTIIAKETESIATVLQTSGKEWQASPGAKIMLLGDSFTNIYSLKGMGWGSNAGFAQHLSYQLQAPLDLVSLNDAGAFATRERLASRLKQQPGLLNNTKVLIWQFAERELAVGNWKMIELPPTPTARTEVKPDVKLPPITNAEEALARIKSIADKAAIHKQPAISTKDDWLFLTSELEHLAQGKFWGDALTNAETQHDPLAAIVDLKNKLEEMGIEFALMPAPPRSVIYADKLLGEMPKDEAGNIIRIDKHHQAFYELLREQGVNVIDLTDAYLAARKDEKTEGLLALQQDTHWSPRGVRIASEELYAEFENEDWVFDLDTEEFFALPKRELTIKGDLVDRVPNFGPSTSKIFIEQVSFDEDEFKQLANDDQSPILLLTDSHGLVFNAGEDMHTKGAGLSDWVSYQFGIKVDLIAQRGSGAAVRRRLAFRFLQNPEDAESKRVVIYSFAARELSNWKNWKPVPLKK